MSLKIMAPVNPVGHGFLTQLAHPFPVLPHLFFLEGQISWKGMGSHISTFILAI